MEERDEFSVGCERKRQKKIRKWKEEGNSILMIHILDKDKLLTLTLALILIRPVCLEIAFIAHQHTLTFYITFRSALKVHLFSQYLSFLFSFSTAHGREREDTKQSWSPELPYLHYNISPPQNFEPPRKFI